MDTAFTSKQLHTDANGNYTPERQRLHQHILDRMFTDTPKGVEHPFYMALWGGANSAKSVVLKVLLKRGCLGETPAIFGMEAFADLPEFQERLHTAPHPEKEPFLRDEYYDLMMQAVVRARQEGCNLVIDDHGDEVAEYKRHLDYLSTFEAEHPNAHHMQTLLLGQAIDPTYFMFWLEKRPAVGEHNPSKADNHAFTQKAVQQFQKLADTWEQLAPLYECAVLNETAMSMLQKIERIATYDRQPDGTQRITFDAKRFAETVSVWRLVNPLAYSSDTLWPQAGIDAASDIRRRVVYDGATTPPHYKTEPHPLIHAPSTPLKERIHQELDHRRPNT